MSYIPEYPPRENLAEYVFRELARISAELDKTADFEVLHAEPARLYEGMVRYADGTDWNPGSGAGVYVYKSGWVFLG